MKVAAGDGEADAELEQLKRLVARQTGLECGNFKDNYLRRRLAVRMRATRCAGYAEYLRHILGNPDECGLLLDDITINVTHFFRDKEVFRLLEERVLPMLVYDKIVRGRKIIRIWSAGCASGEEAYSLAILLRHVLGDRAGDFIVSVHGTDIDRACLEHARQGEYLPRQIEDVPPDMLERYFERSGEGYKVREQIREMTKFILQDLFAGPRTGHYDLISCRNVMIYFSRQMQQRLFSNFHDALNDRGYLVIGKTETLLEPARALFATVDVRERVFQKAR